MRRYCWCTNQQEHVLPVIHTQTCTFPCVRTGHTQLVVWFIFLLFVLRFYIMNVKAIACNGLQLSHFVIRTHRCPPRVVQRRSNARKQNLHGSDFFPVSRVFYLSHMSSFLNHQAAQVQYFVGGHTLCGVLKDDTYNPKTIGDHGRGSGAARIP